MSQAKRKLVFFYPRGRSYESTNPYSHTSAMREEYGVVLGGEDRWGNPRPEKWYKAGTNTEIPWSQVVEMMNRHADVRDKAKLVFSTY